MHINLYCKLSVEMVRESLQSFHKKLENMMESLLCEDPSLKEDQSRLEKCKILFSTLKSSELLPLVPEILVFLNDRWSVIRVECGKQLAKLPGAFSEDLVAILIGGCSSSSTWQEIHGSILGLNGLVASAESRKHASLLANISSLCLGFIGNANIPIKEASRSCLISIQRRISDKATLVHQIIGRVDIVVRQSDSDTEANSLILDGLLSCLVDNYQMFPELVRTASSSAGAVSSVAIVQTLRCCALHPASTVRQRAGQILTLFLLSFFKDDNENDVGVVDEVPQLVLVITELLRDALQTGREEDCWCLQEISLMVAEELVRVITEQKLDMLNAMCGASHAMIESTTASAAAGSAALLDHALGFLAFLKNHLHLLLAHSQFEVRRMAVQLTPQLARVYVLMNVPVLVPAGEGDGGARAAAIDLSMHVEARRGETAVQEKDEVEREGLHVISEESLEHSNAGEDNSGDREHGNRYSLTSVDSSDTGGVCNQGAAAAASGSLNRRRDFGLRVLLNAGLNAQRNDSGVPRLDLPLIAEMVWVSEVVKENQHLFEAYGLSEQWKTNSATSELQMRTSSVKDSVDGRTGRCSMSRHSECDEEGGSSFGEDGCARSVVDHWSLDVRGRLQEIEKRTQFHRSVKSIVAASLDSGSTAVVALLASNCQAILTMADHLLTTWDQVFRSETDSAAFTSTLLTFNSVLDSHLVEGGPTVLTVDMLECCALLESFFLSVQYRLVQCPDIANSSCPALEEAAFLVSAAECQRQRLLRLSTHWLQHLAQIQCISRCSTHISSRSAITGHSTQRPSASELLLVALAAPTDKRIQQDLFSSTDSDFAAAGCDTLGNSVRSCSIGVMFHRTLTSVRAQMSTASGKDASPRCEYPVEDVFADMQRDRVLLTSSLTNAAASIHSVSFAPCAGSAVSAAADLTYLQTPSHALSHSVHSTPHTSLHHNRASLTPSGFTFSSPPVPPSQAGATPSGHSSSGPLIHRYQAMDQWNCEAVSPLLTCIAGAAASDPRRCIQLAAVVVEWVAACVMHPLWLDCRHNARKNLFESLAQLLVGAERSATLISVEDSAHCLLILRIVRAIAEVLTLRSAKPLLELKTLLCLVKAAAAGVRLLERYLAALRGHCSDPAGRLYMVDDDNTALLQAFRDVYAFSMQGLMQETAKRIYLGVEYYKTVFPLPVPPAPVDTLRGKLSSPPRSHGRDPMSPARRSQSSELLPAAGQGPGEDEFSDWDEDSESDEGPACLSDSSAAATATQGLLRMLWEEADGLSCLVAPWEQHCAAV